MTPRTTIAVTGIGAVTPIGASAFETAEALRAGVCRFREDGVYVPLAAEDRGGDIPARATGARA